MRLRKNDCGRSLHDQFAPPKPEPPRCDPEPAPPSAPIFAPVPTSYTSKTLNDVRAESCYKTLRGLIDFVIGFGLVLVGLGAIASFFSAIINQDKAGTALAAFISIVLCGLVAVLLVAFKQVLVLGIDAADVLIAERADRLAEVAARRNRTLRASAVVGK